MASFKPEPSPNGCLKRDDRWPAMAGGDIQTNPADLQSFGGGMEIAPC